MQIESYSPFDKFADKLNRGRNSNSLRFELSSDSEMENSNRAPFLHLLGDGIGHVNELQSDANEQIQKLLTGQDVQSAEVLTSIQKADMSFRLLVQIRNKLMKAYDELNQIRV